MNVRLWTEMQSRANDLLFPAPRANFVCGSLWGTPPRDGGVPPRGAGVPPPRGGATDFWLGVKRPGGLPSQRGLLPSDFFFFLGGGQCPLSESWGADAPYPPPPPPRWRRGAGVPQPSRAPQPSHALHPSRAPQLSRAPQPSRIPHQAGPCSRAGPRSRARPRSRAGPRNGARPAAKPGSAGGKPVPAVPHGH